MWRVVPNFELFVGDEISGYSKIAVVQRFRVLKDHDRLSVKCLLSSLRVIVRPGGLSDLYSA